MSERVLSGRALNRALLARQSLLERTKLPIARALERVGGLQTQYAPSGYIGLWSRLHGLRRDAVTKALEERRVVQATLMRATIHMVSARDYALLAEGIRKARRETWRRGMRREIEGLDMRAVAAVLRRHLEDGPRRRVELIEALEAAGFPRAVWSGAGLWLDMVRVPPSGTWERRRADLFGLAGDRLGPSTATEAEGLELLIRRYLGGFGPARANDVANWAGVPVTSLRPVLERLSLRRFRDAGGAELLDLPRAPLPEPGTPAPVRFLGTWDATLLAHARRAQILPERYRQYVFDTKMPQSVPVFLADGEVAGKWRYEKGRILLEPFDRLRREVRGELDDEAERLAAFHAE